MAKIGTITLEDCKNNLVEIKRGFLDGSVKSQEQFDSAPWESYTYSPPIEGKCSGDDPYLERALFGRNASNGRSGIRLKLDK